MFILPLLRKVKALQFNLSDTIVSLNILSLPLLRKVKPLQFKLADIIVSLNILKIDGLPCSKRYIKLILSGDHF